MCELQSIIEYINQSMFCKIVLSDNTELIEYLYTLAIENNKMVKYNLQISADQIIALIKRNNLDVLKLFLETPLHDADKKIKPLDCSEAFIYCCKEGNIDMAKYLLETSERSGSMYFIKSSHNSCDALQIASKNGHLNVVKFLLELPESYNIELADDGEYDDNYCIIQDICNWPIMYAIANNNIDIVKYFMTLRDRFPLLNPAANENWAANQAAKRGHFDMIKYLKTLPKGYKIFSSYNISNLLDSADRGGNNDISRFLREIWKEL